MRKATGKNAIEKQKFFQNVRSLQPSFECGAARVGGWRSEEAATARSRVFVSQSARSKPPYEKIKAAAAADSILTRVFNKTERKYFRVFSLFCLLTQTLYLRLCNSLKFYFFV